MTVLTKAPPKKKVAAPPIDLFAEFASKVVSRLPRDLDREVMRRLVEKPALLADILRKALVPTIQPGDVDIPLAFQITKWFRENGYVLASSSGFRLYQKSEIEKNQAEFGILREEKRTPVPWYHRDIFGSSPPMQWLGTLSVKSDHEWSLAVYGRESSIPCRQLANDLMIAFGKKICLRLVEEKVRYEQFREGL